MIEVYTTVIDEKELIGMGPLWVKRRTDMLQEQLHNEREFYFSVYTRGGGSIVITTDWMSFKDPYIENSTKQSEAIAGAHKALRHCLPRGCFTEMLIVVQYPPEFEEHEPKNEQHEP